MEILCLQYNFTGRSPPPTPNFVFLAHLQSNIFHSMKLKYLAVEVIHSLSSVSLAVESGLYILDAPRRL